MIKLSQILKEISSSPEYLTLNTNDKNLYETYILLGELLNPDNSYPYEEKIKGLWEYKDIMDNIYFVRLTYQPTTQPHFELKTGYYNEHGKPQYDPPVPDNSTSKDWNKRSDTVAKIYRDEIIPMFIEQNISNILIIKPLEIKRYQFSVRLIDKFTPNNIQIKYNKPQSIVLTKP